MRKSLTFAETMKIEDRIRSVKERNLTPMTFLEFFLYIILWWNFSDLPPYIYRPKKKKLQPVIINFYERNEIGLKMWHCTYFFLIFLWNGVKKWYHVFIIIIFLVRFLTRNWRTTDWPRSIHSLPASELFMRRFFAKCRLLLIHCNFIVFYFLISSNF